MENTQKSKGKIIAVIVVFLLVAIITAVVFAVVKISKKGDKEQKNAPYYEAQIKEFAEACKSNDDMKKYVKEKVNLKAYYAMSQSVGSEEFEEAYKNAKKEDYETEEFIDGMADIFMTYVVEEEKKLEVKDIEEPKDIENDNTIVGKTLSQINGVKSSKFTLVSDGVELDVYAYFYDEKMFVVMPDFEGIDRGYEEEN